MKVKDILNKINGHTLQLPVVLREASGGEERQAVSFDFSGYYYPERDRTVKTMHVFKDKVVIYYK